MPDHFRERRERVLRAIEPGALVVFSAPVALRNNDVEHEYRQDSDFYYLTGLDEQESVLVLKSTEPHFVLFVRPRNPERETWDGPRAGVEGAVQKFGAVSAYPIEELDTKLPELLNGVPRLFCRLGQDAQTDARVHKALATMRRRARLGVEWPTYVTFVVMDEDARQRFCSVACRLALRRVLDREARYRQRRRRWRREQRTRRCQRRDTS
jgi:Xaa-Pro aminopeptidase